MRLLTKKKAFLNLLFLFGSLFLAHSAFAQNFITVTATVTDPNGIPYAGGTMNAILVPGTAGGWTLGGQPYSGRIGPIGLDSTGSFTANFGSNAAILPASSQWQITVNSNPGGIQPPLGTGAQSFTVTMTISGPSPQSISSILNAAAPKLTNFAGAGGGVTGCTTTGGVAFENGTANILTCGALLTFNGTTFTDSASAASTQTAHFGDPDTSIPNIVTFSHEYPGRNEITAVGGPVDTLDALIVTGYNGPNHAIYAANYLNTTIGALPTAITSSVVLDGTTGSSTSDAQGTSDFSSLINGANLTGDGFSTGLIASFRAFPIVNNFTTSMTAGSNSHADFLYGFFATPTLGTGATGDASTVTNLESFRSAPVVATNSVVATNVRGFHAVNASIGVGGGAATNQYGFVADALSGASNNFGFFSALTNKDQMGLLTAATYSSATNCSGVGTAANPSVATCTAAPAGSFSCATAASTGTCRVNTTAVTANSQIFVQEDDSLGTRLGVTCNTNNVLPATAPLLGARSAGVSFTINLGTFSTNPLCFSYFIVN